MDDDCQRIDASSSPGRRPMKPIIGAGTPRRTRSLSDCSARQRYHVGLLSNGKVIRLVYAPRGETSGYIHFDIEQMATVAGRPIFSAMYMLLSEERLSAWKRINYYRRFWRTVANTRTPYRRSWPSRSWPRCSSCCVDSKPRTTNERVNYSTSSCR